MAGNDVVVVTGATGRQGGAVARRLLADGWRVCATTRSPDSGPARELARLGAEVVRADMDVLDDLRRVLAGAHGVFSVQNPMTAGADGERTQGMHVMEAAAEMGVSHVVQASGGPGVPATGVASWDVKLEITGFARSRGLPLTVLRPMAFLELMTDKDFYPPATMWHLMPRLVGADRPIPWISATDVGEIAALAFADPQTYLGADLPLAGDVRTLAECRETWRHVTGRPPRRFPMPEWLFERFTGPDLTRMWRWLATHEVDAGVARTRALHPAVLTVDEFVRRRA